ncbi:MAG: hypothetical protein V7K35_01285 [Nostoc sp.]
MSFVIINLTSNDHYTYEWSLPHVGRLVPITRRDAGSKDAIA